ncbi:C10 family peptidase [Enterobacter sp. 22325]|uniref:C10 family peptidase n=1 Tax=Enterobacter sp. 22325 TaxID=3453911 RepID=UPI003F85AB06
MGVNNEQNKDYPDDLIETAWSQDLIYSAQLYNPESLIGCTPVAFGQIMRYYKFPAQGKGVIKKHESLPEDVDIDGFNYSYESMPRQLTSDSNETEIYSISILLAHIAYAFKTQVKNSGGSATHNDDVVKPLVENFSYDKNIKRVNIYDARMSLQKFSDILKTELNANRPVYVGIPGHSIVCTGYDETTGLFSFNYGWGSKTVRNFLSNLDPSNLFYCIKPEVKETLKLASFDYDGQTNFVPGSTGMITLEIENIDEDLYDGCVRIVLRDDDNYSQDVLSNNFNISISGGGRVIEKIEFVIPSEPSFGVQNISIQYEGLDGELRYLTDYHGEFASVLINTSRDKTSEINICDGQSIPENFTLNTPRSVALCIKAQGVFNGNLFANVVDSNGNIIKNVGEVYVSFSEPGEYLIEIDINISDLKTQVEYSLQFMVEEFVQDSLLLKGISEYESGITCYQFMLLNEHLQYQDDALLNTDIDISEGLQYLGKYDFKVSYSLRKMIAPHYIYIEIIDENRNVLFTGKSSLSVGWGVGDYIASVPLITRDSQIIRDDLNCSLVVSFFNLYDNTKLVLTPKSVDVYNPSRTVVQYRKLTDYVELTESVMVSKTSVFQGETFDVTTVAILKIPHGEDVYLFNYKIYLKGESEDLIVVGAAFNGIGVDVNVPYTLTAVIPENLPSGRYEVYSAFDFNDFYGFEETPEETILKSKNSGVNNSYVIEVLGRTA